MMSKKQWTVLLCLFLIYLLMGAGIFYTIESNEEYIRNDQNYFEKIEIYELFQKYFRPNDEISQKELLDRFGEYCGRPIDNSTEFPEPLWDFYHSFFFAFTVVSTIGYGNLAPTTMVSRILMIFYGLIGIPINGILLATLGDFFGKTFIKVHQKWKTHKPSYEAWKLGLCGQIALYLIPGFLFFIFIPAYVIMICEEWDYDLAVYYAFVTLTTIGFGDYVAGVKVGNMGDWFIIYQIFLIIWIVFGLGYLVMILGFITRGMRSKQVVRLEHKLASNIKSTQSKIWHGFTRDIGMLRKVLNEIYMLRFKPVYRDDFNYTPTLRERSLSCPDLTLYRNDSFRKQRRRAYSESVHSITEKDIGRVQSDTDLERIDRKATFGTGALLQPCDLLAQVVSALGNFHSEGDIADSNQQLGGGIHGFTDSQILASEKWRESGWTIGEEKIFVDYNKIHRERAYSEYAIPANNKFINSDWTWSGPDATKEIQEIRKKAKPYKQMDIGKIRGQTRGQALLSKIKKPFIRPTSREGNKLSDVSEMTPEQYLSMTSEGRFSKNPYATHQGISRGSLFSMEGGASVLEETTVGDLLRAITSLNSQVTHTQNQGSTTPPRRKLGTDGLTPPKLPSLLTLFPPNITPAANTGRRGSLRPLPSGSRRMSLRPPSSTGSARSSRRFSVRPVELPQYEITNEKSSNLLAPPSMFSERKSSLRVPAVERVRSHSLYPDAPNFPRLHNVAMQSNGSRWRPNILVSNLADPRNRTRHDSLTDIKINKQ